jgi:hypothetical protein
MSADQQDKKMNAIEGESLAGKDDKVIPAKPTDLSDEELDKVAGGGTLSSSPYIKTPSSTKGGSGTLEGFSGNDTLSRR